MAQKSPGGYMGRILRVDLTRGTLSEEHLEEGELRRYLGGTGLGTKFLYEEVGPGVKWSDPENRLMFFPGPLSGTRVAGSGTYSVVAKGALTELAGATQANGFFGAFLKFCGFDGLILQGRAPRWQYLYIHDGTAELREASHLVGKDIWETEDTLRKEVGSRCSISTIGPAGEKLVRFACIVSDRTHVAAHNGVGAVMGSKRLKAVVVARGRRAVPVRDRARLAEVVPQLFENARDHGLGGGGIIDKWGTAGLYTRLAKMGALPVKNYTTTLFPEQERFTGQYLRTHFEVKITPCWACRMGHSAAIKITEGPYKGFSGDEPEYEQLAAMSSVTGQVDPAAAIVLSNLIDRLGMDVNEAGWVLGWAMECYEKGLLKGGDLDGLEMSWGNVEAMEALLRKIAHRQGVGDLLAEGVKRAAERVGGEAQNCAVYAGKGASPRGHDHRARWDELIDTCLSNTGTIEVTGGFPQPEQLGLAPVKNRFDPLEVSTMNAKLNGRRQFEDSLGVCRFCMHDFQLTVAALSAVTGWDYTIPEAMEMGLRVVNQLRLFNLRHGLTEEMEMPSARYASAPPDGPAQGVSLLPHWEALRRNYWGLMGWDPETGKPLPQALERVGLGHLIPDLRALR